MHRGESAPREMRDLPEQRGFCRVHMCLSDPLELVVGLHDVESAVIRERRHSEAYQGGEGSLIAERRAQHAACLGKERRTLLGIFRLRAGSLLAYERG